MTLDRHLARLRQRIEACGAPPDKARALLVDLDLIANYASEAADVTRALTILFEDLALLADLEKRSPRRAAPTDLEVEAAVVREGGVRAAARALSLDPSTVSRRLRALHATPKLLNPARDAK